MLSPPVMVQTVAPLPEPDDMLELTTLPELLPLEGVPLEPCSPSAPLTDVRHILVDAGANPHRQGCDYICASENEHLLRRLSIHLEAHRSTYSGSPIKRPKTWAESPKCSRRSRSACT